MSEPKLTFSLTACVHKTHAPSIVHILQRVDAVYAAPDTIQALKHDNDGVAWQYGADHDAEGFTAYLSLDDHEDYIVQFIKEHVIDDAGDSRHGMDGSSDLFNWCEMLEVIHMSASYDERRIITPVLPSAKDAFVETKTRRDDSRVADLIEKGILNVGKEFL